MKRNAANMFGYLALLLGVLFFFTQCESELNGFDQEDTAGAAVELRDEVVPGNGLCVSGAGPGLSVDELCSNLSEMQEATLTDEEVQALLYMREEEKLARDVYLALSEQWSMPIFANISRSEQRHMDAVGCLLDKYDLGDPTAGKEEGEFTDPVLQAQYDALMAESTAGLEAALQVGAKIEDLDIFDLQQRLPQIAAGDVEFVFQNLMRASGHHLKAFVKQLTARGITYEPFYLSPEAYEEALSGINTGKSGLFCDGCPNCAKVQDRPDCDGSGPAAAQNGKGKKKSKGKGKR